MVISQTGSPAGWAIIVSAISGCPTQRLEQTVHSFVADDLALGLGFPECE